MKFTKMHGLGNDFIVLDWRQNPRAMTPELAGFLAHRQLGIGCDQVIILLPPTQQGADLKMQIFNPDGSHVGLCGNAARCVVGLMQRPCVIETFSGLFPGWLHEDGRATVDMGKPKWGWQDVPMACATDTQNVVVEGLDVPAGIAMNVGIPHIVFPVENTKAVPLNEIGPLVEHHKLFPERINVNFMEVKGPCNIVMRVWERGTGATLACGTGATASFVAARAKGMCAANAEVHMPGGTLLIGELSDGRVTQTGEWTKVYEGEIDVSGICAEIADAGRMAAL